MTADERRAAGGSYKHIQRREYLVRAHEFAPRGEQLSKLTERDVIAIRENKNGLTDKQQAEKYNMSEGGIFKIRHRHTWAHITMGAINECY